MMENFHLEAKKYIDVPFRHRGRTVEGLDCVGLIILAAKDCGYDKYKEFAYGRVPNSNDLLRVLNKHFGDPVEDTRINDVVLMRLPGWRRATHVGIVTHHPTYDLGIIHVNGKTIKVVYQGITEKMKTLHAATYRWPNG